MKVIVCIDDRKGLMFNHRRLSQDRYLTEEICKIVGDNPLYVTEYSAPLFGGKKIKILSSYDEDFYEFIFLEQFENVPEKFIQKIDTFYLCK